MEWLTELITTMHWGAVAQIIMIDILLGGDNAVVIAAVIWIPTSVVRVFSGVCSAQLLCV